MSTMKLTIVAIAGWMMIGVCGASAFAQGGGPSGLQYTPPPAISPYNFLFNAPPGTTSAYLQYVQPALQQNALNTQQAANNQQQAAAVNALQQQLAKIQATSGFGTTGSATGAIRPTGRGVAANYMDYSHYYTMRH